MFELKHVLSIFVFCLVCLISVVMVGQLQWERAYGNEIIGKKELIDDPTRESYFKRVHYYKMESEQKVLELNAYELVLQPTLQRNSFFSPKGVAYTEPEQIPVAYQAERGVHYDERSEIHLWENVLLEHPQSKVAADELSYKIKKDDLWARGDIKSTSQHNQSNDEVFIESQSMTGRPRAGLADYRGDVSGEIKRARSYEPSLYFWSDTLSVDLNQEWVGLNGNVRMKNQDLTATSLRGEIFLENYNKKLKYYVLYDDVKIVEKIELGGEIQERRAFAEKLEGIMSENLVVLTGYPKVFQNKDVIRGNRIILRENNEVVEVEDANTNFILGE